MENQNILKRIKHKRSEYSVKEWSKQWRQSEQYRNNISEFPDALMTSE